MSDQALARLALVLSGIALGASLGLCMAIVVIGGSM